MSIPPWHVGHWRRLSARRQQDVLPHALLLCGPPGLDKRGFLRSFARGLLCQHPEEGDACGRCKSCLLFDAGTHPDYVALSYGLRKDGVRRQDIVVDQIRDLSARLAMASQFGGWQIAGIDPADAMNTAAANALLKTLEEPAARTMLILVADAPWRMPATIRSRCQRIDFKLPGRDAALAWLQQVGVRDAEAALAAAGGNPGLARRWAEEGALARRQEVRDDLAALAGGRANAMTIGQRWLEDAPQQRLWFAAQAVADEMRARATAPPAPLDSALDSEALIAWYDAANRAREALRGPLRSDLLLLELLGRWR